MGWFLLGGLVGYVCYRIGWWQGRKRDFVETEIEP